MWLEPGAPAALHGAPTGSALWQARQPGQRREYLASKFGDHLEEARALMAEHAAAGHEPGDLSWRGFRLYEQFRPAAPTGESGWGAKGELDLRKVRALVSTG